VKAHGQGFNVIEKMLWWGISNGTANEARGKTKSIRSGKGLGLGKKRETRHDSLGIIFDPGTK